MTELIESSLLRVLSAERDDAIDLEREGGD